MYKVLKYFTDLQDNNHPYQPEDEYPRAGLLVSEERLAELSGTNNRRGIALIEEVPDMPPEDEILTPEEYEGLMVEDSVPKPIKRAKRANKKEN